MFLKAIIKVTSRTESFLARKRKSAIMQWKRQFPVALSRRSVSLFLIPTSHSLLCRNVGDATLDFCRETPLKNVAVILDRTRQDTLPRSTGIIANAFRRGVHIDDRVYPYQYRSASYALTSLSLYSHFRSANQLCLHQTL